MTEKGSSGSLEKLRARAKAGDAEARFALGLRYRLGEGVARDKQDAIFWWKQVVPFIREKAESGDAAGQFAFGDLHYDGEGVVQDKARAVELFEKAAGQGYAVAQFSLGFMYYNGEGVAQDKARAVELYRQAAEQGNAAAQYNLGVMYYNGEGGLSEDKARAVELYRQAAEQGNAAAQCNLGGMYEYGEGGLSEDKARAVELYRQAAEQGNAAAQCNLGVMYEYGEGGLSEDKARAVELYRQAAKQGHARAQFNLALMHANGDGVAQDKARAVEWLEKAAAQGLAEAQNHLGVMHYSGDGVKRDGAKAAEWWEKAAKQGNAAAQFNLALRHANGDGVAQDKARAVELYRQAADQGNARAQFNLALMHANGDGVAQNKEKAAELYRQAAEQGDARAQFNLALMHANGDGVARSKEKAAKLYQQAAKQGYVYAQNNLGILYATGEGGLAQDKETTKLSTKLSTKLFQQAADQGNAGAQYNYGLMLVKDDKKDEAKQEFQKAAKQGHVGAENALGKLGREETWKNVDGSVRFDDILLLFLFSAGWNALGKLGREETWKNVDGSVRFDNILLFFLFSAGCFVFWQNADWQGGQAYWQMLGCAFIIGQLYAFLRKGAERAAEFAHVLLFLLLYFSGIAFLVIVVIAYWHGEEFVPDPGLGLGLIFICVFWGILIHVPVIKHVSAILVGIVLFWWNTDWQGAKGAMQLLGAIAVGAPFILSVKFDEENKRNPAGYKAFVAVLWGTGMALYFRDATQFDNYYNAVLAGATIFILILAFRTERLVRRTITEDDMLIRLYRKTEATDWLKGKHKNDCLTAILRIDQFAADNDKHDPNKIADEFGNALTDGAKESRQSAMQYSADKDGAAHVLQIAEQRADRDRIADLQADAEAILHSKAQGDNFCEKIAMCILTLVTTFGLLAFLPSAEETLKAAPRSGFFVEVAAMLIASIIVFLLVNIFDLQKDRSDPILSFKGRWLEKFSSYGPVSAQSQPSMAGAGGKQTFDRDGGESDYDVQLDSLEFRYAPSRKGEKMVVFWLCLFIAVIYGVVFWEEWTGHNYLTPLDPDVWRSAWLDRQSDPWCSLLHQVKEFVLEPGEMGGVGWYLFCDADGS